MAVTNCKTCGKAIPGGMPGGVCALCRVGLVPLAKRTAWEDASIGSTVGIASAPVDENSRLDGDVGRQLTGLDCPDCGATLTINDLRNRACSVCDARLGRDLYRGGIPPVRSRHQARGADSEHPVWPADAPYW